MNASYPIVILPIYEVYTLLLIVHSQNHFWKNYRLSHLDIEYDQIQRTNGNRCWKESWIPPTAKIILVLYHACIVLAHLKKCTGMSLLIA